MSTKILDELIETAPHFAIVKIYHKLMNMDQFKGGVVATKKYISEELNLSQQHTRDSIEWLKEHKYITETKIHGQTQFILNDVTNKTVSSEEKTEVKQPRHEIIRKGGKTVTRMEIPDF